MKVCYLTFSCEFSGRTKLDANGNNSQFISKTKNDNIIVLKNRNDLTLTDIENAIENIRKRYVNDVSYNKYDSFKATLIGIFELLNK